MIKKKEYREIVDSMLAELQKRTPLTDTTIGSVNRTLVETIASEISALYEQIEHAYLAGFIDTASGPALDLVVGILGLQRKTPQYAVGSVTFYRRVASHDVTILRGTRVSTRSTDTTKIKLFETTISVQLPRGQNEVEVPIRALIPGEEGVADFETITELESPIIGVDGVVNKKPTTIGTERESDEELRARAKATVLSIGKATVDTIRNAVLSIPGVRSVTVNDMPSGIPGEVDIIIDGLDLTDKNSPQYIEVAETINRYRPAGILVNIKSTTLVKISVELFVRLRESYKTDEAQERAVMEITDAITRYLNSLKIGVPVLRNRLISTVLECAEVYNVDELRLSSKVFDAKFGGMIEDTRKRLLPTGDLQLGAHERAVPDIISVFTQYTPRKIAYVYCDFALSITLANRFVSERRLRDTIENTIYIYLSQLKPGEPVDYNRLVNVICAIEGLGKLKDLSISALHEETGVIITNAKTNIKIGEHEIPKLRNVMIEVFD